MRILHLRVSQVPFQSKDHVGGLECIKVAEKTLVLIFLLFYKALYKSLKCHEVSF